jgi:hypothetical protein
MLVIQCREISRQSRRRPHRSTIILVVVSTPDRGTTNAGGSLDQSSFEYPRQLQSQGQSIEQNDNTEAGVDSCRSSTHGVWIARKHPRKQAIGAALQIPICSERSNQKQWLPFPLLPSGRRQLGLDLQLSTCIIQRRRQILSCPVRTTQTLGYVA